MENKVQMKMTFLCLDPLSLKTNILSNSKTKAILLSWIKGPIARLLLLLSLRYVKRGTVD